MKVREIIRLLELNGWHAEVYLQEGWLGDQMSLRYAVVIEKAESNYAAYVPDLDGCVATGKTIEETEHRIREAIELQLQAMKEVGEPIPAPTSLAREVEVSLSLCGRPS